MFTLRKPALPPQKSNSLYSFLSSSSDLRSNSSAAKAFSYCPFQFLIVLLWTGFLRKMYCIVIQCWKFLQNFVLCIYSFFVEWSLSVESNGHVGYRYLEVLGPIAAEKKETLGYVPAKPSSVELVSTYSRSWWVLVFWAAKEPWRSKTYPEQFVKLVSYLLFERSSGLTAGPGDRLNSRKCTVIHSCKRVLVYHYAHVF